MKISAVLLILYLLVGHAYGQSTGFTPSWAKEVVWYQIFPERFRNGDLSNDPPLASQFHAWPHDTVSAWQIHPWTSDWYALQPWEKANGKSLNYNITRRRYGGDLQGIIDQLPYLKQLGISAIYLNPIFWSPSHHKYDGFMYHHVDPYLGPNPKADIALISKETYHDPSTWTWTSADTLALSLIKKCHSLGIRIIFDGVFNHLGSGSPPFQDVVLKQQKSTYRDWFMIKSWNDSVVGTSFAYDGWFGVPSLPEIKEDKFGIVEGPRQYILASTERWMNPKNGDLSYGIDGWRLDVAFCVDHAFWKWWRKEVRRINPEAYLTAEVIDELPKVKPYLQGDEFDAIMNYNFAFACADFFVSEKTRISASDFVAQLDKLRNAYAEEVSFVQQNLFGSHDSNRLNSHIVNKDFARYANWGDYFGKSRSENPAYQTRKPTEEEYQIQKLFAVFQMCYLGAPMIYYGDEVGMWGANDPDCRKPMVWSDLNYTDEIFKADGTKYEQPQPVFVREQTFDHYQKLIQIRNSEKALQLGTLEWSIVVDDKEIIGFKRNFQGEEIFVVVNNSTSDQLLPLSLAGNWTDLYANAPVNLKKKLPISAKGFYILKKQR